LLCAGSVWWTAARRRTADKSSVSSSRRRSGSAAALEDENYPLDELIYDWQISTLATVLREENRWPDAWRCLSRAFRVAIHSRLSRKRRATQIWFRREQVVATIHKNPLSKHAWVTDLLGRRHRPDHHRMAQPAQADCARARPRLARWRALQQMAKAILRETESRRSPTCRWSITRQTRGSRLILRGIDQPFQPSSLVFRLFPSGLADADRMTVASSLARQAQGS